jgi:serine/threonine-protein kinase HipA
VRVHQEDVCQALAVHPARKYQSEGGPGAREVVELLRQYSGAPVEEVLTFVDALAFNWIAAATDAHAKNYSILFGREGLIRLAPLYDLASALPYSGKQIQKLKLAMSIGGRYRVREIGAHRWEKLAGELKLSFEEVRARVQQMAAAVPDLATSLLQRCRREGLSHRVLASLADALAVRAVDCAASLER